jgi:integrase
MQPQRNRRRVTGHLYRIERKKGPVWGWKIRLPYGGQERHVIGPEWQGKGRPPQGYFTKRTARALLEERLTDLRRGIGVPAQVNTTFGDAAEEWFSHGRAEKGWKPSTIRDYRSALNRHLLPAFESAPLESITASRIDRWRSEQMAGEEDPLPLRTSVKLVTMMHAIFERARKTHGLEVNPVDDVEQLPLRYTPEDYDFYSPEEVWALVRASEQPEEDEDAATQAGRQQDGVIFLTAAFSGLRLGELLALRVRDVDFGADSVRVMGSYDSRGGTGTTKGGHGRTVPMVPDVAQALARHLQREHFTGRDDLVFEGDAGAHLDGSALRRRYRKAQEKAKLRKLRFHDLRHTFGSLAINAGSIADVQAWLGHADARTTGRYVHYKRRSDEAKRLETAFKLEEPGGVVGIAEEEKTA